MIAPYTLALSFSLSGTMYLLSSASMVKANLYLELQALDGTPSKHGSVCPSAALLCINRCGGKGRRARSLQGVGGLLSGSFQAAAPSTGTGCIPCPGCGTCSSSRGAVPSSSPPPPYPLFLGMLSGWLRHLTFARANISSKGVC